MNGSIDDVRIYNYARTPAQIAWDYNRGAPVGWWKMDECQGTTAYDASGNGNNGTITIGTSGSQTSAGTCTTSGTAWGNGATGKYNASLNFDGTDDKIAISDTNNTLDATDSVTVAVWIKPTTSAVKEIILKGNTWATGNYELFQNNLNVSWRLNNNAITSTTTTNPLSTSNWNHLVATYDKSASSMKIYVNGKLEKSDTYSTSLTPNNEPLHIAAYSDGSYDFNGQIDDVRIYNYALTPLQVKQLYNEGAAIRFGPQTGAP